MNTFIFDVEMNFFKNTLWLKRIVIFISFIIMSLILWNTYVFFQKFKQEERHKMEILATAQKEFVSNPDLNANFNLSNKIISSNTSIPMILADEDGVVISWQNLDSIKAQNPKYLVLQLQKMKAENNPVEISYFNSKKQFIYYRNSDLLNKLTYYPLALILILILFLAVIYMLFSSNKIAEQNKLWTGMAKETAHQIGTPLSSLLGWIEILKLENVNKSYILEMQKDISRLNTIATRFSKIGAIPKLEVQNIVLVTKKTINYLQSRSSKQISFYFSATQEEINATINTELFDWVIENLIKNAIDAMQGKGKINLKIETTQKKVKITVSDTGKGISKSNIKHVFKPGFTTKKRGWGLGLSLSKRIIKEYHNGKIVILKSQINKGTSFQILLDKNLNRQFLIILLLAFLKLH